MNKKTFYITTTLPYVNAKPHLGTALEFVLADVIARYRKLCGDNVFFNTGTDEHGQKIYKKALEENKDPKEYVDEYADHFKEFVNKLNIVKHCFIRTTDEHHMKAAQVFWIRCSENGYIEKKKQRIKYCIGCELEKTDSELEEGECPIHPNLKIEESEEENYFFKLSQFQEKLLELYEKNKDFVQPEHRFKEITNFVKEGLHDFSISRLKNKMPWGVPVPGDDEQVMYVWFDALVNYISAIGWPGDMKSFNKWWPVVQIAGKDQLRPQIVMWQAMLMSVDIKPSEQVLIHGFVTSRGEKMSKSLGNVIDPVENIEKYGLDALRYYLVREIGMFNDSDFTVERFEEVYKSELQDGIGNLHNRILSMVEQYCDSTIPIPSVRNNPFPAPIVLSKYMDNFDYQEAIKQIRIVIESKNETLNKEKPWALAKEGNTQKVNDILYEGLEILRNIAWMILPIMPNTADEIFKSIGLYPDDEKKKKFLNINKDDTIEPGLQVNKGEVLFPPLEER